MVNLFQYTYMLSQSPKNLSTNQFEFIIYQGPAEYKDLHTCILGHWWPISNGSLIQFPEIGRPVEPGVSQGSKVWGLLIINLSLTQGWGQVEQLSWSLSNEEPPLDQFFLVLFWAALKLQPAQIQIARFATKQQYNPPLICGLGRLQIWAGLMPDESTEFWSDVLNSSSLCSFWHF